jgi:hypothetical protein
MTKCCLRLRASQYFEVVYPQSTDTANLTFYDYQSPYFYEYRKRDAYTLPNHVVVFYNNNPEADWENVLAVEDEDTDSSGIYGDVYEMVVAGEITSTTEAEQRASTVLHRLGMEVDAGSLVIPHHCQIELYDKIAVVVI